MVRLLGLKSRSRWASETSLRGNLGVLTPLEGESLQPSNLTAGAENYLSVFFQVIHAMPENSYILFFGGILI